eukprot:138826-Chlamydomonas_euryale.AAC.1
MGDWHAGMHHASYTAAIPPASCALFVAPAHPIHHPPHVMPVCHAIISCSSSHDAPHGMPCTSRHMSCRHALHITPSRPIRHA